MACFNPLIGVYLGDKADGKKKIKIISKDRLSQYDKTHLCYQLPCGKCVGCRKDQANEWSNRLLLESLYHKYNYFVTLTYCDEYLPYTERIKLNTGEITDGNTLVKEHISSFVKRLRQKLDLPLRFYAAGEYGDVSERSHYHLILFMDEPLELYPFGMTKDGYIKYRSSLIESCWIDTKDRRYNKDAFEKGDNPNKIGNVEVEIANYNLFRYIARYVTKKVGDKTAKEYIMENRAPPFNLCSRSPGIGYQYFIDHPEEMEKERIYVSTPQGVVNFPPPRYYKKKFREYNPVLAERRAMKNMKKLDDVLYAEMDSTNLDGWSYLALKASNEKNKVRELR